MHEVLANLQVNICNITEILTFFQNPCENCNVGRLVSHEWNITFYLDFENLYPFMD